MGSRWRRLVAEPGVPSWQRPNAATPADFLRDIVIILVVVAILLVASTFRRIPNERLPPAQALTDSMEQVYDDVRAGRVELPREASEVALGVQGQRVSDARWAVAGEMDGVCYAMWWDVSGLRRIREVARRLACTPENGADDSPRTIARSAPAAPASEDMANWEVLWPDAVRIQIWWLPLVFVTAAVALSAAVRIVIMAVTGRSPRGMR